MATAREIGAREIGAREIGAREIGARDIGAREIGAREIGAQDMGKALACSESSDADANRAAVRKSVDAPPRSTSAVDNGKQSELLVRWLQRA
jgi:hypothetical protein